MKSFSILVFILVISLFIAIPVSSANDEKIEKVSHVASGLEKVYEKVTLFLKFDNKSKANYQQHLTEKRLAELSFVIESNQIDSVEPTASRYATSLGTLTDFVVSNRIVDKRADLMNMFDKHSSVAAELQKRFEFESGWWLVLQHDINTINIFKEKIKGL